MLLRINQWIGEHYRPDLRSLSIMRIAVAIAVIIDLIIRTEDLTAHYTDSGMWPVRFMHLGWRDGYWSLHAVNGSLAWQVILFSLHFVASLFLLSGWHTRRATFITWLLLVSLHNRNLFVLQGGDDLLRLVLFTGIMLPWGSRYSVDSRNAPETPIGGNAPYLLYLLLITSVYLFSALLKSGSDWRGEGTAVYYALSLEQLRLPVSGELLYRYPSVLKALTRIVLTLEFLIPLCILLPGLRGRGRTVAFVMLVILHSGIAAFLYVGLFPLIGIATAIGLLPGKCFSPDPVSSGAGLQRFCRPVIITFCIFVAGVMLMINLESLPNVPYQLHSLLRRPAAFLRLDQFWGMFSPTVMKKDGWFVYEGIDEAGQKWDLRRDTSNADFSKPPHIVSMYSNDRWRKLAENMQGESHTFLRPLYAGYVLRKWNSLHPRHRMQMLNLYFMEKTNLPGYRRAPVKKVLYCVTDGRQGT